MGFRNNEHAQQAFDALEVSDRHEGRRDTEIFRRSLRRALNVVPYNAGSIGRRWGSRILADAEVGDAKPRYFDMLAADGTQLFLAFTAGRVDIHSADDGSIEDTISSSVPWGADDITTMSISADDDVDEVLIVSRSFMPQVLSRASDGSWSLADWTFRDGISNAKLQPYYRFAAIGVSVTPSSTTGSVTLTFSDDVMTAEHVGARVRILEREILITGFTAADEVTGTWQQVGYPTFSVTVADTTHFTVGESVKGSITEYEGIVTEIVDGTTLNVLRTNGTDVFSTETDAEDDLIGPRGKSQISACTVTTPAETTVWDEQMISPAVGYPGCGTIHANRYWFADFPKARRAIIGSGVGDIKNYALGDQLDDDAISTGLGDAKAQRIRYLLSAEQLIIFAEKACYYLSETVNAGPAITPGSVDFPVIGPLGISDIPPHLTADGAMFIERSTHRVIALTPTGNLRRAWQWSDLSEIGAHLIGAPKSLAVFEGSSQAKERLIFIEREDGGLAVGFAPLGGNFVGWTEWTTTGAFGPVCNLFGAPMVAAYWRGAWRHALFDATRMLDDSVVLTNGRNLTASTNGSGDLEFNAPVEQSNLADREITLCWNDVAMGVFTCDSNGAIEDGVSQEGDFEAGVDFEVEIQPHTFLPANRIRRREPHIVRAFIGVVNSGPFRVNGRRVESRRGSDDPFAPPPLVTKTHRVHPRFRKGSVLSIGQSEAAPFEINFLDMEVSE